MCMPPCASSGGGQHVPTWSKHSFSPNVSCIILKNISHESHDFRDDTGMELGMGFSLQSFVGLSPSD